MVNGERWEGWSMEERWEEMRGWGREEDVGEKYQLRHYSKEEQKWGGKMVSGKCWRAILNVKKRRGRSGVENKTLTGVWEWIILLDSKINLWIRTCQDFRWGAILSTWGVASCQEAVCGVNLFAWGVGTCREVRWVANFFASGVGSCQEVRWVANLFASGVVKKSD